MDDAELADVIVREADDAITVADVDGNIRLWNRGAERMFGWAADEVIGRSLDIIIPEKLRARHNAGYRRVVETGVTDYVNTLLNVPALHRDGSRISLEFSIVILRDDHERVTGIAAIMREVTERHQTEKRLRAEIAELRRRLGEE